jgi:AmmeMemoRadiSam system protein B
MAAANVSSGAPIRALIAPHAGYSYCGDVMAFAYKAIDPKKV